MIVVFLGPPGSGKGTQAKLLSKQKHWPQLSTGDMLRASIEKKTRLGEEAQAFMDQGKLVPDSVVIRLIEERNKESDCRLGFILDGFPRNISQAQALDQMLSRQMRKVDWVIFFDILDVELVKRFSGRRTCVQCGSMFHLESVPSKLGNQCDQCGGVLSQRPDDQPEVVEKRLAIYHEQTEPLVGFYSQQNKLKNLDARLPALEVFNRLSDLLK